MGLSIYAKNKGLDALTLTYVSAHDGDPGDDGSNEVSGGSPAYARKAIAVGVAAAGIRASTTLPIIDIPSGTTVDNIGFWDALTGGNFYGFFDVVPQTFNAQGTYQILASQVDLNATAA